MTTTNHERPHDSDELRLRLPHAHVVLRGSIPSGVADALGDLTRTDLFVDPSAPAVTFEVTSTDDAWLVQPRPGDPVTMPSVSTALADADLLDALVGRLNRLSFDLDPLRLHLHCAALDLHGTGILLAGASGSGKSTISVELISQGAAYLTDECVSVLPGSSTVFAYPKPITLKAGSLEYFATRNGHPTAGMPTAGVPTAHNGRANLRAGSFGTVVPQARIGVIVAVRHAHDEPAGFTPLSAAEACVRLLSDSLDGVRLGPSALDVLAQVAAGATAWELVYDDAAEAAELIADIRPPFRRQLTVLHRVLVDQNSDEHQQFGGGAVVSGDPNRSADHSVRVARFDGSAVLHDGYSRSLVVLDAKQIAVIEGAGGTASLAAIGETLGATITPVRVPDPFDPMGFGLPGRPVSGIGDAPPITQGDVDRSVRGQCTGVLVEQWGRGRPADATTAAAARRSHEDGQSTCLLLERELPGLVDLLEAVDAPPVVLKGPVSAHDGPLPAHLRDFGDLDLLVAADRIDAAAAALMTAGFERCFEQVSADFDSRFAKSITLQRPFAGDWGACDGAEPPTFELDLHRTLIPGPFGERVPLDELHTRAVAVRIHNRWYRTLHPEHRFLHACLHVVLGSPEPRLHSVRDLVTLAPRTPSSAKQAAALAQRWGMAIVLQRGLAIAESTFPGSLPPELLDEANGVRPSPVERFFLASHHRPGRS